MSSSLNILLDEVFQALDKDSKTSVDDGHFYLKFLESDLLPEDVDSKGAWEIVKKRIDNVFGADLLDWGSVGQSSGPTKSEQYCFATLMECKGCTVGEKMNLPFVAILTIYISAVHYQKQDLYSTLVEKLSSPVQEMLEKLFQNLLENEAMMSNAKLNSILASIKSSKNSTGFSTPKRSDGGNSAIEESFSSSPPTLGTTPPIPNSPLQDFYKRNTDILEKKLKEIQSSLIQEKNKADDLEPQVSELLDVNEKLKNDLNQKDVVVSKLNGKVDEYQMEVSSTLDENTKLLETINNLKTTILEKKDSEKYSKILGSQVEQLNDEIQNITTRNETQSQKLQEKIAQVAKMEMLVGETQLKNDSYSEEIMKLQQTISDLKKEILDIKDVNQERQVSRKNTNDTTFEMDVTADNSLGPSGESMADVVALQLRQDIDNLKSEKKVLQDELDSANGKLQSKEEELTKSLEDIENMKACVKSVESELEQVSSKKSSDKDEVGAPCNCEAQKRSENMEKIQKQLHEELLTSNKKVEDLECEKSKLQEEVSLVKKELNEKSENYTSLQLDFQKMSDEKKSIEEQLADVKPLISSKEEQLKVTMRGLENMTSQVKELQEELAKEKSNSKSMESDYQKEKDDLEKHYQDLNQKLGTADTEIQRLRHENSKLKEQNQSLGKHAKETITDYKSLKKLQLDNQKFTSEKNSLKDKISYLDGELKNTEAEHEKEIKSTREQANKLQEDLKQIKNDHENQIETINNVHTAVVKQFEEEILGHKDSYQSLLFEVDTLKNEKEKLHQDLEVKNKQKKDLEKNIVQAEQKKNEEVAAQKQKYETKVKTLKETIETKYRKKVEQAMEKWKTDKVALENQCKDVIAKEKENSQKNSEIHNIAKRKLDEMERKLKSVVSESNSKIESLETSNQKFVSEQKALKNQIASLENGLKNKDNDSEKKLVKLNEQFSSLQAEMKKEKENTQKQIDRYNIAKSKLEEMVNRFEEVSTESDNEISKLTEETKTLRQTIELLETRIRNQPSSEKLVQEKQALQNEVKRLEMEIKRNLQTQNDASAGTKNQTPSGRVVMASKPPQSEKPVGNLKSSNQSPIPNATGMKMAAPKVSAKSAPIVNNAVGVQKTKNSPSTLVETPPTEAIRNNRKRNNKNDLGDEGSNKKTRVSEPVTPVATITPGQKRVVYTTTNKPAVSTPSTVSNAPTAKTQLTDSTNKKPTRSAKAANQTPKNQNKMSLKKVKEQLQAQQAKMRSA